MSRFVPVMGLLAWLGLLSGCQGPMRRISMAEYQDKVYASWLGQCIGNMYGLSHEFRYNDQPRTEPIEGWMPDALEKIRQYNGAFSDDDTDIEYVDLFCMEKYGPEPTYEQLAEFWKRHINNNIWVANLAARNLMNRGYLPPLTGRRGINPDWFQIDPQLVCEIWAVTTPGMVRYAAAKADWAAKVTNDDYGTHPTIWYNAMWAAAFFETDVNRLCQIGYERVPAGSIFREAIDDVRTWKAQHGSDWVSVRAKIKQKYHDRVGLPEGIATGHVSALLNGALGVLALLYGEGDFEKTMQHACMAGYDADNQCATLAGMIAMMKGSQSIPRKYTYVLESWDKPLNDFYKNRTRDALPDGRLTEMAERTTRMGKRLVVRMGGHVENTPAGEVLVIPTGATFTPPLEVRLLPVHVSVDSPAIIKPEVVGGKCGTKKSVTFLSADSGSLPPGLSVQIQQGFPVLAGTPSRAGTYHVGVSVSDGQQRSTVNLPIHVHQPNLAHAATLALSAITAPTGSGSKNLDVLRDDEVSQHYDSFDGQNELAEDFYGYVWATAVKVGRLVYQAGPVFDNGGWFDDLNVQYRDNAGQWHNVQNLTIQPAYTEELAHQGKQPFTLRFDPVATTAIRVVGKPGGTAQFTSIAELEVHPQ